MREHGAPEPIARAGAQLAPSAFVLLWSSSFITARVGLALVSPLLFVAVRLFAAAALLALAMAVGRQRWSAIRGRWHHLAIAGALVNGVTLSAFHVAMVTEHVAVMALVQSLSPMLIALSGAALLGERLRAAQWLGLVLGTIGVASVVAPRALESLEAWGSIRLSLVGVAGLAGGTIYFRRFCRELPLLPATTVQVGAGAALSVALTAMFEVPRATWSFAAVAAVTWNVLAVSIGAMALYYFMLTRGTAGRVAANFYLVPGTVAIVGWALFGEHLTPRAMLGFGIASLGVYLVARSPREP
jgi:drug/metabolite transporter (DMT)-like permease